ncbi:hypothetical protein EXIGLDRAFT_614348 [Exidia glandulosa HHB12029]|uniref:GH16 domain-containing protein n=1 Tax=Exidia glandulosa HHB12029 TaxID=1314781 RepID=A0A165HUE3_EXIGL|nr:hypothetical protein EXIGLDRAFT_614348 [Exidia glandulosa HHB12029]
MKRSTASTLLALAPLLAVVRAQQTCNSTSLCGADAPCCSEFGFCSADFCGAGCNPLFSNTVDSCNPIPICEDKTYTFPTLDVIANATTFNGNVSLADWTLDKGDLSLTNENEVAFILTETNGGTRISSTRYVHYGTITATMKTGKWDGVVTAFITMSDVHDEIDWEWPGKASTLEGQSNYFWLGVVNRDSRGSAAHGDKHNITSDASSNYHDYTIDWQEDELRFLIDGQEVRSIKKSDTKDSKTSVFEYPTTPARVQFSLWPAGINGSAQGTIDWSGGNINFQDPDYIAAGHFYALLKSVKVECAKTGAAATKVGDVSYVYGANASGVPTVFSSNESAVSAATAVVVSGMRAIGPLVAAFAIAVSALML